MVLPKESTQFDSFSCMRAARNGYTLIEIIMVMAFIAMLATFALIASTSSLRAYAYHSDRGLLFAALFHARAEAVGNVCTNGGLITCTDGVAHGVHIETSAGTVKEFVVFQGSAYDPSDPVNAVFRASGSLSLQMSDASNVSEVVFQKTSAAVNTPGTIVLTDITGRISTTTIGEEGQIYWTH